MKTLTSRAGCFCLRLPYFMPQFTLRDMADFFRRSYPNWSQEEYQRLCKLFPLDPR